MVIATGGTEGLAEWIIDDTCHVFFAFVYDGLLVVKISFAGLNDYFCP